MVCRDRATRESGSEIGVAERLTARSDFGERAIDASFDARDAFNV